MRRIALILSCIGGLTGCVMTPPLEQATGGADPKIMIKDVVVRVKCELSDAFDRKTEDPKFLWLADWTVKADLTLIINDSAGLTPTASYTKFHRSTANTDAGPTGTSGGKPVFGLVPQSFTFGFGGTLSSQATRTETVSFTVALDELKMWRQRIDREESAPSFPPEKRTCHPAGIGLTENLGLKEWVESAFFPVEARELEAGIHPQPLSQKGGSVPKASTGVPSSRVAAAPVKRELTYGDIQRQLDEWKALDDMQDPIDRADADIKAGQSKIKSSQSSLDTKITQMKIDAPKYKYVLAEYFRKRLKLISSYRNQMWNYARNEEQCLNRVEGIKKDVADSLTKIHALREAIRGKSPEQAVTVCSDDWVNYYNLKDPNVVADTEQCRAKAGPHSPADLAKLPPALMENAEKNAKKCAEFVKLNADDSVLVAAALPDQIDPPIDSVLHSVNFVIAYGATISPSWSLIQWKGPAQNGTLAGATGTQTNTLDLAMGPRNGKTSASNDAVRLITNQTVRALGQ